MGRSSLRCAASVALQLQTLSFLNLDGGENLHFTSFVFTLLEEIKMSVICLRLRDYSHIKTRLLAKYKTLARKQQLAMSFM